MNNFPVPILFFPINIPPTITEIPPSDAIKISIENNISTK